jgi:hypothetical protein
MLKDKKLVIIVFKSENVYFNSKLKFPGLKSNWFRTGKLQGKFK